MHTQITMQYMRESLPSWLPIQCKRQWQAKIYAKSDVQKKKKTKNKRFSFWQKTLKGKMNIYALRICMQISQNTLRAAPKQKHVRVKQLKNTFFNGGVLRTIPMNRERSTHGEHTLSYTLTDTHRHYII